MEYTPTQMIKNRQLMINKEPKLRFRKSMIEKALIAVISIVIRIYTLNKTRQSSVIEWHQLIQGVTIIDVRSLKKV